SSRVGSATIISVDRIKMIFGALMLAITPARALTAEPLPPWVSASKEELLTALSRISDINSPDAEVFLWQLGVRNLNEAERKKALRFLDSRRGDNFSAAAFCLRRSTERDVRSKLRL